MTLNIIPSTPENLNKGENRILEKIKGLYKGIDRESYLYVQPRLRNLEPDFILIDPTLGISIIEVKDWNLSFIDRINRVKVFSKENKVAHNPAFRANQYFNLARGLFDSDIRLMDDEGNPVYKLYSRVMFTRILSDELENIGETLNQYPTQCLSSQRIKKLTITDLFGDESCYINDGQLLVLRSILFPEIKIFETPEEDIIIDSSNVSEVYKTIKGLDHEQEKFAKRKNFGHYMVSGVPGSGKTVILRSRAIFLLKENPDWIIKIVTYNKSLKSKIEARLDQLSTDFDFMGINADNISVSTFHKLALDTASISVPPNAPQEFWDETLPQAAIKRATPIYDAILIDEYQDFRKSWFELCLKLAKKHQNPSKGNEVSESIFLAGDRLQSIYNTIETSWKSIGINISGRSKCLKHTYRTGKEHIELALKMLLSNKGLKQEVRKFYEGEEGISNQTSIANEIKYLEGDYNVITNLVSKLIKEKIAKPSEILILTKFRKDGQSLYNQLPSELKQISLVTKNIVDKKLIITTYHSAKGLESRICILLDIDKFDESEMKLMYVGMTRASQQLYFHSHNFNISTLACQIRNQDFEVSTLQSA